MLLTIEATRSLILNAETGQRGYLLTGKESYLKPYFNATRSLDSSIQNLQTLTHGNNNQQNLIRQLVPIITAKTSELRQTIVAVKGGHLQSALQIVYSDQGKNLMESASTLLNKMSIEEQRIRDLRTAQTEYNANVTLGVVVGGSFALFFLVVASTLTIQNEMRRREEVQEDLRQSEQQLNITLHSIGDALIATDHEAHITLMNPVAEQMTGWSMQEACGKPSRDIFRIVNETTRKTVVSPIEQAIIENQVIGLANHTVLIAKDGTEIPIDDIGAPIHDKEGGVQGAIVVFRDISEHRKSEAALRASEELFRITFENMPVGIAHVDLEGRWLRVNPKLCAIVGYKEEELLSQGFQEITHPEDLNSELDHLNALIRGEVEMYTLEKRFFNRAKDIIWVNLTVSLLKNSAGEPQYCITIVEDISERKIAQIAVNDLNARLKRAMQETHHRIKNNLQVISALVDMQVNPVQDEVPLSSVRRISQYVSTLATIHDLLTQSVDTNVEANLLSTRSILDNLIPLIQSTIENRLICYTVEDILVEVKLGAALAFLTNELISNAIKHGAGPIDVTFKLEPDDAVGDKSEARTSYARLKVCDDGPGFPPEFELGKGPGIGMKLVQSLGSWDMNGKVTYENAPQGGACVSVVFPVPEEAKRQESQVDRN